MVVSGRRGPWSVCIVVVVVLVSAPAASPSAGEEPAEVDSPESFVRTVRAAFQNYLDTATRLCGTVRERSRPENGNELWVDAKIWIEQNGRYGYYKEWRKDYGIPKPSRQVLLYGPAGFTMLGKTADGNWYVSEHIEQWKTVRESCWILSYYTAAGYFLRPGADWSVAATWWSDTVEVQSVQWTELDGRRVLKATYALDHPLERHVGTAWVDPEWTGAIVRLEKWRGKNPRRPVVKTITYDESFRPAPVPKILEVRTPRRGGKPDALWRSEFNFHIPDNPPKDDEFTLAAFGIDPLRVSDEPAKRSFWLWLGLLASLLAAILWWARQRLQQKANVANEHQR